MKALTPALKALLATKSFLKADLYDFTLIDGTVLHYTSYDIPLTVGTSPAIKYTAHELQIQRSNISQKSDLSVDTMNLNCFPIAGATIKGLPVIEAIKCGMLDGATVALHKCFMNPANESVVGTVSNFFFGRVGEIQAGRTAAVIPVNSITELLDTQTPSRVYQPQCIRQLYDTCCGVSKAAHTASGSVTANKGIGDPSTTIIPTTITTSASPLIASGHYDLGIITFTSGANNGFSRSISSWDGGTVLVFEPFPFTPLIGDTLTLSAGCDKTMAMCQTKFNNLASFRGTPFVPVAETAI